MNHGAHQRGGNIEIGDPSGRRSGRVRRPNRSGEVGPPELFSFPTTLPTLHTFTLFAPVQNSRDQPLFLFFSRGSTLPRMGVGRPVGAAHRMPL